MTVLQMVVLAGVALVLGLFVLRPLLLNSRAPAALPPPDLPLALPGMAGSMPALTGVIEEDDAAALTDGDAADPVARLRRLIAERQAESVEILRGWMEMEEERG
jgi:flagellar M-ring protein FliF